METLRLEDIKTIKDIENLSNEDLLLLKGILIDNIQNIENTNSSLIKEKLKQINAASLEEAIRYLKQAENKKSFYTFIKFLEKRINNYYLFLPKKEVESIILKYTNESDFSRIIEELNNLQKEVSESNEFYSSIIRRT